MAEMTLANIKVRIESLEADLLEMRGDLQRKENKIAKYGHDIQTLLGQIALGHKQSHASELPKELEGVKKLLAKHQSDVSDLKVMISTIERARTDLIKETDEAIIRESPGQLEKIASDFNKILDGEALEFLAKVTEIHGRLKARETEFHSLMSARQKAMSRLGKQIPVALKESLGRLALEGGVYGSVFSTGLSLQAFIGNLEAYKTRVENFAKFNETNPGKTFAQEAQEAEESRKPWAFARLTDMVFRA